MRNIANQPFGAINVRLLWRIAKSVPSLIHAQWVTYFAPLNNELSSAPKRRPRPSWGTNLFPCSAILEVHTINVMDALTEPNVFEYFDVVLLLQAHFAWRKAKEPAFNYAAWCKELGLSNRTILRFILQRKRRISERTALALKSNLRLRGEKADYFDVLMAYSQATSEASRTSAGARLISLQRAQYRQVNVRFENDVFDTYGPIVLTLLGFRDFRATSENIAKFLNIEPKRAENLIQDLIASGHVRQKDQEYVALNDSFKIPDMPQHQSLRKYHENWLEKASDALNLDFNLRRFRSLKFALNEDEFASALKKIDEFALAVLGQFHNTDLRGRRLYMIENVIFPITEFPFQDSAESEETNDKAEIP